MIGVCNASLFILTPYREKRAICKLLSDLLTKGVLFTPNDIPKQAIRDKPS